MIGAAKIGLNNTSIVAKEIYKSFVIKYLEFEGFDYKCSEVSNGIVKIEITWE